MLRRSLFVSALMLASVVGFASSAKADTKTMTLTGIVNPTCNLTSPITGSFAGTVVPDANNRMLSTTNGTPAKVGIQCSDGTLKIDAPISGGSNPTPTTNTAKIMTVKGTVANSNDSSPIDLAADGSDNGDATVTMDATVTAAAPATLGSGNYSYTVVVTAVP